MNYKGLYGAFRVASSPKTARFPPNPADGAKTVLRAIVMVIDAVMELCPRENGRPRYQINAV